MLYLSTQVFFCQLWSYKSTILQVKNESHGRKTDESHFHVLVVSEVGSNADMVEAERQNT